MMLVDHVGVAHPADAALGPDVGGDPLERHHGDGAGVLGDLRLLGGDDVHDHAALEHLGHAPLDAGGAGLGVVRGVLSAMRRIVRPSGRLGADSAAASSASAWRRTLSTRTTTVSVLASASAHSVTYSRIGRSKMSQRPVITRIEHQPVGALGDPAPGVHAERLGLGAGVGGHRPHHQAVRARRTGRGSCRRRGRSRARGRRRRRRRRTGRGWSPRTRRTCESRPSSRAIVPSIRSLNTKAVITRTPMSSSPCGKKTSAPAHTPRVPTSVTASGLMPSRRNSRTNGRQDHALPEALESVEHARLQHAEEGRASRGAQAEPVSAPATPCGSSSSGAKASSRGAEQRAVGPSRAAVIGHLVARREQGGPARRRRRRRPRRRPRPGPGCRRARSTSGLNTLITRAQADADPARRPRRAPRPRAPRRCGRRRSPRRRRPGRRRGAGRRAAAAGSHRPRLSQQPMAPQRQCGPVAVDLQVPDLAGVAVGAAQRRRRRRGSRHRCRPSR